MSDCDEDGFSHTTLIILDILCPPYTKSFSQPSLTRLSITTRKMKFTIPLVALSLGTALGAVINMPGASTVSTNLPRILLLGAVC